MHKIKVQAGLAAAAMLMAACATQAASGPMGFFITSAGSGKGADLGGLAGAKTWRAYLSMPPTFAAGANPAVPAVNARDRIGNGPWFNAKGELVARDLAQLHGNNHLSKTSALDERGQVVKGRGDNPNQHDILTGSRGDGTAFAPQTDTTCGAWTQSGATGSAIVGHQDRSGPLPEAWAES